MATTPFVASDLGQADNDTTYLTGDLRRTYAFGDRVSELSINRDNLFRVLSKLRKFPTSDPIFKVIEERPGVHKRYAYANGFDIWSGSGAISTTSADYTNTSDITALTPQTAGSFFALEMVGDYKTAGNVNGSFGQSGNAVLPGATGTCPNFFIPGQVIKINTKSAQAGYTCDDYFLAKILQAETSGVYAYLGIEVVRPIKTSTNSFLCSFTGTSTEPEGTNLYTHADGVFASSTLVPLEDMRTYVVGTAFAEGSGYPDTFIDQPYQTSYGFTQIFKTSLSMTGTAEATEYKLVANEKSRLWANKLQQHTWDIADAIYWSKLRSDSDGARHTQGIIDYILNYGNVFSLATTTSQDDFLDHMSILTDPRFNSMDSMLFLAPTHWYNWLHKLGGYALTNLKLGVIGTTATYYTFSFDGTKRIADSEISQFNTLYGTMNVMRDIHLDGSPVKLVGVNLNKVMYRPLVGNGKNRDTKAYLGVQSIENSGTDATIDLILTEAGVEITGDRAHAVWL